MESERKAFLSIGGTPVYFEEDWATGIGGGLWSTGLAIARYLEQHPDHARKNLVHKDRFSLLELGSGNGFLAVCFLALAKELFHPVAITDFEDHLPLIKTTLQANSQIISDKSDRKPMVLEHKWGEFPLSEDKENPLNQTFDLIVGSDLAYRDELHDPLIASLRHFSHSKTVTLLGVTMHDTKPSFFFKLKEAGFTYERMADHLLDLKFRGTSFGVFVIRLAS